MTPQLKYEVKITEMGKNGNKIIFCKYYNEDTTIIIKKKRIWFEKENTNLKHINIINIK